MDAPRSVVGCALTFAFREPSLLALQVAPPVVDTEEITVVGAEQPRTVIAQSGARTHVIESGKGSVSVQYSATVSPRAAAVTVDGLDEDVLIARRQSRYCPSDVMAEFAARELEGFLGAPDLADRVASWVFERTSYDGTVSRSSDSAVDTLLAGRGVCRDFAHLTIALFVPARLVSVYAPGINPMDFHAVVEVWRDQRWEVIDPTRMAPRRSLVRIATGRDAADTAFAATIAGDVELVRSEVFAVVEGALPADDHRTRQTLP